MVRAKAKCIDKCGFEIFCSKVGRSTTYKVKTYRPKNICGRAFKNINATSKWVSKVVVESLRTRNDVKLAQIIDDVRFKYSIGICLVVAWKARMIARAIVDRDVVR